MSPAIILPKVKGAPPADPELKRWVEDTFPLMLAADNQDLVRPKPIKGKRPAASPRDRIYQVKYDGYRTRAGKKGRQVALVGRGDAGRDRNVSEGPGGDLSERLPAIHQALARFPHDVVMDGEIIGPDAQGRATLKTLMTSNDRRFVAFDLLYLDGKDLRHLPVEQRLAKLRQILDEADDPTFCMAEQLPGPAARSLCESWEERDEEGTIGKRYGSRYEGVRNPDWQKYKMPVRERLEITGHSLRGGPGSPIKTLFLKRPGHQGFETLAVSAIKDELREKLAVLLAQKLPGQKFMVEVEYIHRDFDGRPKGVKLVEPGDSDPDLDPLVPHGPMARLPFREIWPGPPLPVSSDPTAIFYETVSAQILGTLRGRPETAELDNVTGLLERLPADLKISAARSLNPSQPDWVSFRIAPRQGGKMATLAKAAHAIRAQLERFGLQGIPMTTGTAEVQILVPVRPPVRFKETAAFAQLIAAQVELAPGVALDISANRPGGEVWAPYSVRSLPKHPVVTPLDWSEITPHLDPAHFTREEVARRIQTRDPAAGLLTARQRLSWASILETVSPARQAPR